MSSVSAFWLGSDGLALKRLITRCASTKRRLPLLVWKPKASPMHWINTYHRICIWKVKLFMLWWMAALWGRKI